MSLLLCFRIMSGLYVLMLELVYIMCLFVVVCIEWLGLDVVIMMLCVLLAVNGVVMIFVVGYVSEFGWVVVVGGCLYVLVVGGGVICSIWFGDMVFVGVMWF